MDGSSSEKLQFVVGLIAPDEDVGKRFIETVCGAGKEETKLEGLSTRLKLFVQKQADSAASYAAELAKCDATALLAIHLDTASLENLKAAYRVMPVDETPSSIFLVREPGRLEFKMSCPTCGQKLWVRDEDAGRNGRCPHCKKTFVLPTQTAHLKSVLMAPDKIPMITVTDGHAAKCQGAVAELVGRVAARIRMQLSATVPVQIDEAEKSVRPPTAG